MEVAVGALAARRPCAVIWTMVAWSFLLILGLATMKVQTDGLYLFDDRALYGRYWGSVREYDALHFEVCYHQGIDHCIARGLQAFEPGHGGDHKFRRGFLPARTHSAHLFPHRGVHRSFERASVRETAWFEDRIAELMAQSPLREG